MKPNTSRKSGAVLALPAASAFPVGEGLILAVILLLVVGLA